MRHSLQCCIDVFFWSNCVRGETDLLYRKSLCVWWSFHFPLLLKSELKKQNPQLHCGHIITHAWQVYTFIAIMRLGQQQRPSMWLVNLEEMFISVIVTFLCDNWSWESKPWAICHVFTERLCQEAQTSGGWLLDSL